MNDDELERVSAGVTEVTQVESGKVATMYEGHYYIHVPEGKKAIIIFGDLEEE